MRFNIKYNLKENDNVIRSIDFKSAHKIDIKEFVVAAKKWGNEITEWKRDHPEDTLILDTFKDNERRENGLLGERAVEKFLQVQFVDLKISNSKNHAKPDLKPLGIDCGVKSAQMHNCPLIQLLEKQPQIIVHIDKDTGTAYICGLASPNLLNKLYLKEALVKDADALRNGKRGFCGHSKLIQFQNINDLQLTIE